MKSICVYCGSSEGRDDNYMSMAKQLGKELATRKIRLVYGGAQIGLMGAVASSCMKYGGEVTGIIPNFLDRIEITNNHVSELIQTENMHQRKTLMVEKSDGFIAMPGGFGTLEELAEVITWSQLGLISKPIGILNVGGYYDSLLQLFQNMFNEGFMREANLELFVVDHTIEGLLGKMDEFNGNKASFKEKLGLT